MITFDAVASDNTTEATVANHTENFLQDFLQRDYTKDYKGIDVETTISVTASGRINATTTGDAIFSGPLSKEDLHEDLKDYLTNGGNFVLDDFLSNAGISDIDNIALDGELLLAQVSGSRKEDQTTKSSNSGAIAGGVVGGVVACCLLSLLGRCFARRRRRDHDDVDGEGHNEMDEQIDGGAQ
jgi:hypothetical protein